MFHTHVVFQLTWPYLGTWFPSTIGFVPRSFGGALWGVRHGRVWKVGVSRWTCGSSPFEHWSEVVKATGNVELRRRTSFVPLRFFFRIGQVSQIDDFLNRFQLVYSPKCDGRNSPTFPRGATRGLFRSFPGLAEGQRVGSMAP